MGNDRHRQPKIPVGAPTNGLRIGRMSEREWKQKQSEMQHGSPAKSAPPALPEAKTEARKLYDPPWSYMDPDNPEWEQFRQKRAAAPSPVTQSPEAKVSLPPIAALLEFFKERAHSRDFQEVSKEVWYLKAGEHLGGDTFTKKDFDAAWRQAVQLKIIAKLKGAPEKAKQAKRLIPPGGATKKKQRNQPREA